MCMPYVCLQIIVYTIYQVIQPDNLVHFFDNLVTWCSLEFGKASTINLYASFLFRSKTHNDFFPTEKNL